MAWRIEHFAEIDSTNTWLVARAHEGAPEGLVVYADFQSKGRGRLERSWVAAPATSLLCSILLRPSIDADHLQLLVAGVALSTRAALQRVAKLRPDLKWPNDLIVKDAKLAGILAEVVTTSQGLAVIVGLGLNLTTHPEHVKSTDVLTESGASPGARAVLDAVLEELAHRRGDLDTDDGRERLSLEYSSALATLGRTVSVQRRDDVVIGTAVRVDHFGRLVVEHDGVETTFSVGDVEHVRVQPSESS